MEKPHVHLCRGHDTRRLHLLADGKSFLATAIGYHACKNGIRTLYSNTSKLLSSLKVAKVK